MIVEFDCLEVFASHSEHMQHHAAEARCGS